MFDFRQACCRQLYRVYFCELRRYWRGQFEDPGKSMGVPDLPPLNPIRYRCIFPVSPQCKPPDSILAYCASEIHYAPAEFSHDLPQSVALLGEEVLEKHFDFDTPGWECADPSVDA